MEWWGPAHTFEQRESDRELVFITVNVPRKLEAASAVILGLGALVALPFQHIALSFILAVAATFAAHAFLSRKSSRLSVTSQKLSGNSLTLEWQQIFEVRYESGGEDGPSGLCARTSRWSSKCVFQDASRGECEQIITAIYRKWPTLQMAPRPEPIWKAMASSFGGKPSQ